VLGIWGNRQRKGGRREQERLNLNAMREKNLGRPSGYGRKPMYPGGRRKRNRKGERGGATHKGGGIAKRT